MVAKNDEEETWDKGLDWLNTTPASQSMESSQTKSKGESSKSSPESDQELMDLIDEELKGESSSGSAEGKLTASTSQESDYSSEEFEFEDDADADYELNQLRTEEEKAVLEQNTLRNELALAVDPMDSVQDKVLKANEELRNDPPAIEYTPEQRERKVIFKKKLVEFQSPPSTARSASFDDDEADFKKKTDKYYETSEPTTSLHGTQSNQQNPPASAEVDDDDDDSTVEINGLKVKKTEKVLVERDGKFELVELGQLEAILPPLSARKPANSINPAPIAVVKADEPSGAVERKGSEERQHRPKSAPSSGVGLERSPRPPKTARPKSAAVNNARKKHTKKNVATFAYSPETKELIRKRMAAKAQREQEEEERRLAEKEEARKQAQAAWESWRERKDGELRQKKKELRELDAEQKRLAALGLNNENAYDKWYEAKTEMLKSQRLTWEQTKLEEERRFHMRRRNICENAYACWLRRKNTELRLEKEEDELIRKEMARIERERRKAQRLLENIREAQNLKYLHYYD